MGQLFFKKPLQDAIREGRKRTTIRRWRAGTPGVRAGQRVYSPGLGWLTIDGVEPVDLEALGDADARADGFDTAAGLRDVLLSLYPRYAADGKRWFRVSFQVATLAPPRTPRAGAKGAAARRRGDLHNHPELF
jgi:hypothetical protein